MSRLECKVAQIEKAFGKDVIRICPDWNVKAILSARPLKTFIIRICPDWNVKEHISIVK